MYGLQIEESNEFKEDLGVKGGVAMRERKSGGDRIGKRKIKRKEREKGRGRRGKEKVVERKEIARYF